jgi:hypothetical protein
MQVTFVGKDTLYEQADAKRHNLYDQLSAHSRLIGQRSNDTAGPSFSSCPVSPPRLLRIKYKKAQHLLGKALDRNIHLLRTRSIVNYGPTGSNPS